MKTKKPKTSPEDPIVVDLFAGGGGASKGIEDAGFLVDVALNHDQKALYCHQLNHPNTTHMLKDVFEPLPKEVTKGKHVHLLWMSPDCFPAGTLVLTDSGMKLIELIKVGDLVLTHRGRFRPVTSLMNKVAETVEVIGYGHYGLVTTPSHPFYSKRITTRYPGKKKPNGKRQGPVRTLVENPFWPAASAMTGKLWATPKSFPESVIPTCVGIEFSNDFFYWLGRWIGDGSINKGDVEICCGLEELQWFISRMDERPLKTSEGRTVSFREVDHGSSKLLVWGNASLARWLRENFGDSCESKNLPMWCLSMQSQWKRSLLEGYVDADGHKGQRTGTSSVSKALSIGIRLLAASVGLSASLYKTPGEPGEIEGRKFIAQDLYRVVWKEDIQKETVFWDSLHLFTPVRKVEEAGRQKVFSIEVAEDSSYTADGILVHNCRHFSRAKGNKPVSKSIRSLATVVLNWIKDPQASPDTIILENVREFESWGPVVPAWQCKGCRWRGTQGQITCGRAEKKCPRCHSSRIEKTDLFVVDPKRKGQTFKQFIKKIEKCGYTVDYNTLNAADFGAPTDRRRLVLIAKKFGTPVWPRPTHCDPKKIPEGSDLKPWRSAAECIDWNLPTKSIFDREKPLADKTLRRIAMGLERFVLNSPSPFIVGINHGGDHFRGQSLETPLRTVTGSQGFGLCVPSLVQVGYGEREGQKPRTMDIQNPLGTIVGGGGKHALVAASLCQFFGGVVGKDLKDPLPTVTSIDHNALLAANLIKFRFNSAGEDLRNPLPTITAGGNAGGREAGAAHAMGIMAAYLTQFNHGEKQWHDVNGPLKTITSQGNKFGLVYAFLVHYFGNSNAVDLLKPLPTILGKDRCGLVLVETRVGTYEKAIAVHVDGIGPMVVDDIYLRMLAPKELKKAQGFPDNYIIPGSNANQVKLIGNSVSPPMARAVVLANVPQFVRQAQQTR